MNKLRVLIERLATSPFFWIFAIVAAMMLFILRYDLPISLIVGQTYGITH